MLTQNTKVSTGNGNDKVELELGFAVPETLQECIDEIGEEKTLELANGERRTRFSNAVRAYLRDLVSDGNMDAETAKAKVIERFEGWNPSVSLAGKTDPDVAIRQKIAAMSPDEAVRWLQAEMARLQGQQTPVEEAAVEEEV